MSKIPKKKGKIPFCLVFSSGSNFDKVKVKKSVTMVAIRYPTEYQYPPQAKPQPDSETFPAYL